MTLVEPTVVYVPAEAARRTDIHEHGSLTKETRAEFGRAAIQIGSPDPEEGNEEGVDADAVDAIANILHYVAREGSDIEIVLERARTHFWDGSGGL